MKIWQKFYECECGSEGIMLSSYDDIDINLAFFRNSFYEVYSLSLKGRVKAIFDIIVHGTVWKDMVILNKKEATELGQDLLKFGKLKDSHDNSD